MNIRFFPLTDEHRQSAIAGVLEEIEDCLLMQFEGETVNFALLQLCGPIIAAAIARAKPLRSLNHDQE